MRTPKQHLEEVAKQQKQYHKAGKCVSCGMPTENGKWLCKEHSAKASRRSAEIQRRRIAKGVCVVCGEPLAPKSKRYCPNHLDYYRLRQSNYKDYSITSNIRKRRRYQNKERYKRLKTKGLCVRCGKRKPASGYATCAYCLRKLRERRIINENINDM